MNWLAATGVGLVFLCVGALCWLWYCLGRLDQSLHNLRRSVRAMEAHFAKEREDK